MWRLTFTDWLSAIKASLMEAVDTSDGMSDAPKDKATERWKQIEQFLEDHDVIQNADVRCLSGDSQSHPCEMRQEGKRSLRRLKRRVWKGKRR